MRIYFKLFIACCLNLVFAAIYLIFIGGFANVFEVLYGVSSLVLFLIIPPLSLWYSLLVKLFGGLALVLQVPFLVQYTRFLAEDNMGGAILTALIPYVIFIYLVKVFVFDKWEKASSISVKRAVFYVSLPLVLTGILLLIIN